MLFPTISASKTDRKKKKIDDDDDDDDTDGSPIFKSSTSIFQFFCEIIADISLSVGSKSMVSELLSRFYKNVARMHTTNRRLCYQGKKCIESNPGSGQCSIINEDLDGGHEQTKKDVCKTLK